MTDRFETALDHLIGDPPPKVWSLLITVFGELAQGDGDEISGVLLSRLTHLMRVKPEASRVALHRLRKDGWIESRKVGRQSFYALTAQGRAETTAASARIYDEQSDHRSAWIWLVGQARLSADEAAVCTMVSSETGIAACPARGPDVFSIPVPDATLLPGWLREKLCPEPLLTLAVEIDAAFRRVEALELGRAELQPEQTAVLRVLIVHGWRRVILRTPPLPDHVLPQRLNLSAMRDLKSTLLRALPSAGLGGLEG